MKLIKKHPLWLRILHWLLFPSVLVMVWSGIMIYWANPAYTPPLPHNFYRFFHLNNRLAEGMAIHFSVGWILVLGGLAYLSFTLVSRHFKELLPDRKAVSTLVPTLLHDVGLAQPVTKTGKFNAAQRFAYTALIVIMILEVLSGFAIYKPVQLSWLSRLLGGHASAHRLHFFGMVSISLFFIVHLVQVVRAGWNNFRSMVVGFEVEE